jgi:flagellar M-ring protein FliF
MAEQTLLVPANPNPVMALLRQAGVLVGIAAAVAVGVAVVLWSRQPNYGLLYSSLSDRDLTQVMDALQAAEVPYKVDQGSGAILVPAAQIADARLKLAAAGLPKGASAGFEMLDMDQGFGTSQQTELARHQRALEGELARSIGRLSNVRSARVHLALPKPSVFSRDKKDPSASVLVDLYPGRRLEDGQAAAIASLVAASVPNLKVGDVTVVDQLGRLLTDSGSPEEMLAAVKRFEYTRKIEDTFVRRIENILTPMVGDDGVRAQVTAEVDFAMVEQASESYNPDAQAMRSEQTLEESRIGAGDGGVPGALSNQPPGAGAAPETTAGAPAAGAEGAAAVPATTPGQPQNSRKQATRNFEVDKTVSHTRMPVGSVRRLSVAVLVNNRTTVGEDGKAVKTPLTEEEIARMTALVKEAVGFDPTRGDTVNITNADFTVPATIEPLPEEPIWKQAWVWDAGKQVGGALIALIVAFGVIRPAIRGLMSREIVVGGAAAAAAALPAGGAAAAPQLPAAPAMSIAGGPQSESDIVKQLAAQEPKLAAQVVKGWVNAE